MKVIHGEKVFGVDVDSRTGCAHWRSPLDVIAIKFRCCGEYYPCFECHDAVAGHEPQVWPAEEFSEKAILCGVCGEQLSIEDYLACGSTCTKCSAAFNPGCAKHYHLYFERAVRSEKDR